MILNKPLPLNERGIEREERLFINSDGIERREKKANRWFIKIINGRIHVVDLWIKNKVKLLKAWERDISGNPVQLGYRVYLR